MNLLLSMSASAYAVLLLWAMFAIAEVQPRDVANKSADEDYSEAQKLLFAHPHLANIEAKATLYYDFRQHGSQTRNFDDEIILMVTDISEDGGKDVNVLFLSGENNRPYSDIKNFRSNPLLMFFLQWDVEKMDSGSKITHHYFRHLLRQAFLQTADSETIEIEFEGRSVTAHKVFFQPLSQQQGDARYQSYPKKHYEFIISDSVPGGVYSISTMIATDTESEKNKDSLAEPIESTLIRFNRIDWTDKQ